MNSYYITKVVLFAVWSFNRDYVKQFNKEKLTVNACISVSTHCVIFFWKGWDI